LFISALQIIEGEADDGEALTWKDERLVVDLLQSSAPLPVATWVNVYDGLCGNVASLQATRKLISGASINGDQLPDIYDSVKILRSQSLADTNGLLTVN
jgi:hypothetical protein